MPAGEHAHTESPELNAERWLEVSRDIALALASTNDITRAMAQLVSLCLRVDGLDAAGVYMVDHDARELRLVAHDGVAPETVRAVTRYDFEAAQARLVLAGTPVYGPYPAVLGEERRIRGPRPLRALGVIPVRHEGQVMAALNIASRAGEEFAAHTRLAMETVAAQIGAAVARLVGVQREALLLRELDHRVRNNLSVVQALANVSLTRAGSLEAFREAFMGRIHAMARIHGALSRSCWRDLDVATIAELVLSASRPEQYTLGGPPARLSATASASLALVLHELFSNALVHGALSNDRGRVDLRWTRQGGRVTLDWIEVGGPSVQPRPTRQGGTAIVAALVEGELGGQLEMGFDPGGLRCRIRLQLGPD